MREERVIGIRAPLGAGSEGAGSRGWGSVHGVWRASRCLTRFSRASAVAAADTKYRAVESIGNRNRVRTAYGARLASVDDVSGSSSHVWQARRRGRAPHLKAPHRHSVLVVLLHPPCPRTCPSLPPVLSSLAPVAATFALPLPRARRPSTHLSLPHALGMSAPCPRCRISPLAAPPHSHAHPGLPFPPAMLDATRTPPHHAPVLRSRAHHFPHASSASRTSKR